MAWSEAEGVDYVLGMAKNERLSLDGSPLPFGIRD